MNATYFFEYLDERKLAGIDKTGDRDTHLLSVRESRFYFNFSDFLRL
jgi:hypothetical protein